MPMNRTQSIRPMRDSGAAAPKVLSKIAAATTSTTSVSEMPTSEMAVKILRRARTLKASLREVFMSGHLPPVEQPHRAPGARGEAVVVRDHDDGRAVVSVELL